MKVAVFSAKSYDREYLDTANARIPVDRRHELHHLEPRLERETAALARGFPGVCIFVNDSACRETLKRLWLGGTRIVALRAAGYNNVDIQAAHGLGIPVVRVPAYSPSAVAEHTVGLMLALNRKIHRAHARVREGNFSLEGLLGFDMKGKAVGIVGTGRIGLVVSRILSGFGCRLLAHDPYPKPEVRALGVRYVGLDELYRESVIVTLHCPLTPKTHHMVDAKALGLMSNGVMIVNTSRGALIDAVAAIEALKTGKIGYLGLDVYEEESGLFYRDLSDKVMQDDTFARLTTFPNVVITGHQAYFTHEALNGIAQTTLANITAFERGEACANIVMGDDVAA
ncbi:MAG: 2-hydroxyacid dehydrogenase [Planctomycetota bacterium]|jgi:D-lactate dehydrogenase